MTLAEHNRHPMTIKTTTGALILIIALALTSAAMLNEAGKAEANADMTVVSVPKKSPKPKPAPRAQYAPTYTDEQKEWQVFLKNEMAQQGFTERDHTILHTIIICESGWQQYRPDGTVVVSNGNIGLGQINRTAHEKTYTAKGLDMNDPRDNIRFTIFLYKTQYIAPWDQWSGHCWRPKLAAQGIVL